MEKVFQNSYTESLRLDMDASFDITIKEGAKGSLFITVESIPEASVTIRMEAYSQLKIFIMNQSKVNTTFNFTMELNHDSLCRMGFLDLEDAGLNWKQTIQLNESGADFEILSGQLCMPKVHKVCAMEVLHKAHDTNGIMKNFAVLCDEANYEMVANGNIDKGCYEAQSHQATRVLTLGKDHKAKVIPLLLIDENDVKASHALIIGQPDEEQLYYLQSRGLSTKQAMGLLSVGYFLPVINLIEDQELHDAIRTQMESKVGLYGHQ